MHRARLGAQGTLVARVHRARWCAGHVGDECTGHIEDEYAGYLQGTLKMNVREALGK